MQVQTELYLEEITDRVEEADIQTQTDAFLDRPPTPLFVPAKTGMDVATQIEEGDVSMHQPRSWAPKAGHKAGNKVKYGQKLN